VAAKEKNEPLKNIRSRKPMEGSLVFFGEKSHLQT
jgi:hypothetical protein